MYDDGAVRAVQRRTDHLDRAPAGVARHRVWRIRARQIILATGAHERPIVFADNDRPGILLAGAARSYLHRYGVLVGHRVVVFTTNDSAYAAAADLADAGVQVAAVVDTRPQSRRDRHVPGPGHPGANRQRRQRHRRHRPGHRRAHHVGDR